MKHHIVISLKGSMLAMLNNSTFKNIELVIFLNYLLTPQPTSIYFKQYQIELDYNSLLAINIVKNQLKCCVIFVSHLKFVCTDFCACKMKSSVGKLCF